ncbi:hypothetical protein KIN20_016520 [Parelaphostrongylus tenuis]|uniref:Uncharacterized protein n=1 Tax=Parelaphostrongylus tenuis TaxID=148309 RepID=A0AAD5QN02_PARTN|nr:hypothetical protein KIN20_016520 [Parelaphostrongylus tenuis]
MIVHSGSCPRELSSNQFKVATNLKNYEWCAIRKQAASLFLLPRRTAFLISCTAIAPSSSATETLRRSYEAWSDGVLGRTTLSDRFNKFKAGNEDLMHIQGAGRPQEIERQVVLNTTKDVPVVDDFQAGRKISV